MNTYSVRLFLEEKDGHYSYINGSLLQKLTMVCVPCTRPFQTITIAIYATQ